MSRVSQRLTERRPGVPVAAHRLDLQILDCPIRVTTPSGAMARAVAELWHPFLRLVTDAPDAWMRLHATPEGWTIESSMAGYEDAAPAWTALLRTKQVLGGLAVMDRRDLIVLHAAAVSRSTDVLLLVGSPGAGKTTLCADLVRDGWAYLGDDVAPIGISDGLLRPIPRPPAFKGDTYRPSDFVGWSPPAVLGQVTGAFMVPPAVMGGLSQAPVAPSCIVLPEFDPHEDSVTRMGAADAMRRIGTQVHDPSPAGLALVASLSRSLPVLYLRFSSSKSALSLLSEAIDRL